MSLCVWKEVTSEWVRDFWCCLSVLDHQHTGDLSPGDLADAAETFRNMLLVCHTKTTAVDLSLAGRGEAWGFSVVSSGAFHSYLQSSEL